MAMRQALRRRAGFTLMEVMVVVMIVGFLAMIALPSYQESIRKGRRADAKAGLMAAANREESFMLDRGTYTVDLFDLKLAKNAGDPMITEEGHYEIRAAAEDSVEFDAACPDDATIANCYVLIAKPVAGGAQAGDTRCDRFILDSTGKKNAEGTAAEECW
jgi:type IV pilus assembly protein PilE